MASILPVSKINFFDPDQKSKGNTHIKKNRISAAKSKFANSQITDVEDRERQF